MNDGGPAFPVIPPLGPDGNLPSGQGYGFPEMGMSLRDWFAGQALIASLRLAFGEDLSQTTPETVNIVAARHAYAVADAMILARKNVWDT